MMDPLASSGTSLAGEAQPNEAMAANHANRAAQLGIRPSVVPSREGRTRVRRLTCRD